MSATALINPACGPLSAADQQQISSANQQLRKIRTAGRVAAFNGWVTLGFAVLSAPFALSGATGLLVTIALAAVAANEFYGRRLLLIKFDPRAPRWLGCNQLAFLALISVYCGWMIYQGLSSPAPFAAQLSEHPELRSVLGDMEQLELLYKKLVWLTYGLVIFFTILAQGGNAIYYFTRRRYLDQYLARTPVWIRELQRAA